MKAIRGLVGKANRGASILVLVELIKPGGEMGFIEKLNKAIERNNSLLCVGGMDPTRQVLPPGEDTFARLLSWAQALIEQTRDLVCCYKPNIAFF